MGLPVVLFVDDEPNILKSIARLLSGSNFTTITETDPEAVINQVISKDVAVIVTDYNMPSMNGAELLSKIKTVSPHTVRVLLTGCSEMSIAIEAINIGEVYRFITKPWDDAVLMRTVEDAVGHSLITQQLRSADDLTLLSLAEAIELKDKYTRGHCERVANYAVKIGARLGFTDEILVEIKKGSWLHDCGKIGVSDDTLTCEAILNPTQLLSIKNHPQWGHDIARHANFSSTVLNMIMFHHERFDGTGYPLGLCGVSIPIEARIASVADVCDALLTDRPYRKAFQKERVIEIMIEGKYKEFDPDVVDALLEVL